MHSESNATSTIIPPGVYAMSSSSSGPNPRSAAAPSQVAAPLGYPGREGPMRVVLEQGGLFGRFGSKLAWILVVVLIVVIVTMFSKYRSYLQTNPPLNEKYFSHNPTGSDKVAIITVEGTIMHTDGFAKWQIDRVRDDSSVKAVVLRVDSPGGTITGSHYLYHHLQKLRTEKGVPLVVSMGGLAASGGYYVSMAAGNTPDAVFAEPTTWTGSIGVVIPHYDISELLHKWNIEDDSIASHPLKLMGSPTRKPSEEYAAKEKEILEQLVNESFEDFKDIVKSGRPALAADGKALDQATTGQIFTAKQAQKLGLVDKLGFLEDAVDRAIELANLDRDNVRVVKYIEPKGLIEKALGLPFTDSAKLDLGTLLDLTAPRAYYLCTWLPAVAASHSAVH
jgi:protease-4